MALLIPTESERNPSLNGFMFHAMFSRKTPRVPSPPPGLFSTPHHHPPPVEGRPQPTRLRSVARHALRYGSWAAALSFSSTVFDSLEVAGLSVGKFRV